MSCHVLVLVVIDIISGDGGGGGRKDSPRMTSSVGWTNLVVALMLSPLLWLSLPSPPWLLAAIVGIMVSCRWARTSYHHHCHCQGCCCCCCCHCGHRCWVVMALAMYVPSLSSSCSMAVATHPLVIVVTAVWCHHTLLSSLWWTIYHACILS